MKNTTALTADAPAQSDEDCAREIWCILEGAAEMVKINGVWSGEFLEEAKPIIARRRTQAATGWLPIDTIPGPLPDKQTSENFLIYLPGDDDLGYLPMVQEAFATVHGIEPVFGSSHMEDGIEPTHWMPLPAAPKENDAPKGAS